MTHPGGQVFSQTESWVSTGVIRLPYFHFLCCTLPYLQALFIGMSLVTFTCSIIIYRSD